MARDKVEPLSQPPRMLKPPLQGSTGQSVQGNFDHLQGFIAQVAEKLNMLVDDVNDMGNALSGNTDSVKKVIERVRNQPGSHDDLPDVSANQHHNEDHAAVGSHHTGDFDFGAP